MKNPYINHSVSTATLVPEDYLPKFIACLSELRVRNQILGRSHIIGRARKAIEAVENAKTLEQTDEANDNMSFVVDEFFDELNKFAPEGFYFGSHPGDGADFGFWKNEEEF